MSRRIIFALLAASAALIATQAVADRECFEDSCRVPEAAEPPAAAAAEKSELPDGVGPHAAQAQAQPSEPPALTVTVIPEPAKPVGTPAAEARADGKLAPASVLPKVVAEPALPKAVAEPARVAPGHAETRKPAPAAPPVRAVNVAVPAYVRPERPPQPAYAASTAPAAIVEVPGEIQTGDGLVTVYPNLRHDPAWKLCQIDSRDLGRRSYRCTAYSSHPYGEGGYRPFGAYRHHPAAPGYVVAPNAKIISIDTND